MHSLITFNSSRFSLVVCSLSDDDVYVVPLKAQLEVAPLAAS